MLALTCRYSKSNPEIQGSGWDAMNTQYHIVPKLVDVGGVKCDCCRNFNLAKTKRFVNRRYRRKAKQQLYKELE
jgi:hypothetical protein